MNKAEQAEHEAHVRRKYKKLADAMNERVTRLWAAAEAETLGYGGIAVVARATGIAPSTIGIGLRELHQEAPRDLVVIRRRGGGRRPHEVAHPDLLGTLERLVDPVTRGDPESPLRWTNKSLALLCSEMWRTDSILVSEKTVARLLRELGFSLQAPRKTVEGKQHPDRNAQFEHINETAKDCIARGVPFISVDTKKKELVGNFKNAGREWHLKGAPELTDVHDLPSAALGKAIPYGVLDVVDNSAFVNVGTDHDTPVFAVTSIETWWTRLGAQRYPGARELFITADAGGSNGYRSRSWKFELQRLADKLGMTIHVSHFPPGTSKWNKVEHRLFSFISINWRGRPLRTYETVVNLITNTTNQAGLQVTAKIDRRRYPTGVKVTAKQMRELNITKNDFHGEWNYSVHPRVSASDR